jgi:hypothetical protein
VSNRKNELRDASLDELSMELRERGWRIIPVELLAALAAGAATGFWPAVDKGKDGQ